MVCRLPGSDGKQKALPSPSDTEGGFSFGFRDGKGPPQTHSESFCIQLFVNDIGTAERVEFVYLYPGYCTRIVRVHLCLLFCILFSSPSTMNSRPSLPWISQRI